MSFDKKKLAVAVLGVILGLTGELFNASLTSEPLKDVQEKCVQGVDGLAPYEGWLGGDTFTCMLVQFFYMALNQRDWFFAIPNLVGCNSMVTIICVVESVKTTSFWVKIPFLAAFLGQYLGFGFTFPLLWIPFYLYGQVTETTEATGAHPGRIAVAWFYGFLWLLLLILLVYVFEQDTYAWGFVASIMSGPFVSLPLLLMHVFPKNAIASSGKASLKSNLSKLYMAASVKPLVLWLLSVYGLYKALPNLRLTTIIEALYTDATWASQFLFVDLLWLFLGMLLYVFNEGGIKQVGKATLLLFAVGPAAAVGLTLAGMLKEESEKDKQGKAKTT